MDYNDYTRRMYDSMYKQNIECDVIDCSYENFSDYSMIVVPPLYAASDKTLKRLNSYVEKWR